MGVTSDGHGFGCTFFFELPLYGAGHFDVPDSDQEDDVPGSGPAGSLYDVESPSATTGGRSLCYYPFQVAAAVTNACPTDTAPAADPPHALGPVCFLVVVG